MKTNARAASCGIERLESRIAPAGITVIGKTATWLDWDGDQVTMKWTGSNAPDFTHNHAPAGAVADGIVLDEIILKSDNDAITVSVKAVPGGDGRVDLGYIDATGHPLKSFMAPKVSVLEFDCGDTMHAIGALKIAGYGTVDPAAFSSPGGNGTGKLDGTVGSVAISGDVDYGHLSLGHLNTSTVGDVTIGGSIHGDVANAASSPNGSAGFVSIVGATGAVKVGHDIVGGSVSNGGRLDIAGKCKSITVGGDILGGAGSEAGEAVSFLGSNPNCVISVAGSVIGGSVTHAGRLSVGDAKSVTVGGDVKGGSALDTGTVSTGTVASLVVKGSVIGGSANESDELAPSNAKSIFVGGDLQGGTHEGSGTIIVSTAAGSIVIKGSIIGGAVSSPTVDLVTGAIETAGNVSIQSITIGRNLVTGTATGSTLTYNGAILVGENLGSLTIGGSIEGSNLFRAFVLVGGATPMKPGNFNAIGKITVKGNVDYAVIASGQVYSFSYGASPSGTHPLGVAENPDAGIGAVTIGGNDWHTSLMAGVNDGESLGVGHTTLDTQSVGDATRFAVLGPVVIKGAVLDDYSSTGVSGFEAEQIAKITVGGATMFKHGDSLKYFDFSQFVFAQEIAAI